MRIKVKNIHIILFFVAIIVIRLGIYTYDRIQTVNNYKNDNSNLSAYNYVVQRIYARHPDLFTFTDDGQSIITVSELFKGQNEYYFDIMHDKDGNDCVGYYIINRDLDKNIKVDSSHVCDMIDY